MFVAYVVVSALLSAILLFSAIGKLRRNEVQMASMTTVGVPADRVWLLAVAEIAGAVGLVVGWFWAPLGIAAAIGVGLYFVGAVGAHLRVRDKNFTPAAGLLGFAVASLILRVVSL